MSTDHGVLTEIFTISFSNAEKTENLPESSLGDYIHVTFIS